MSREYNRGFQRGFTTGMIVGLLSATLSMGMIFVLGFTSPSEAATQKTVKGTGQTLIIGDSTCDRPNDSGFLPEAWERDCIRGSKVNTLLPRLNDYIETRGMPGTLIIALGTNGVDNWTKADYQEVADRVWAVTYIVWVTPFRDAEIYGQASYERMRQYAYWMRSISDSRDRSIVAPWRAYAAAHPERLIDGVHEDFPLGEQAWAQIVIEAWTEVRA